VTIRPRRSRHVSSLLGIAQLDEAQHPNGQAVLKLLMEREVTSAEAAEACGISQGTAKVWLKKLSLRLAVSPTRKP
jgi:DNA-directed RNA polymerase specialized sigma24 family protein